MAKRNRPRTEAEIGADALRTGRPPKIPAEKQSERAVVYLTPAEFKRLEALAKDAGVSLASVIMRPWRDGGT